MRLTELIGSADGDKFSRFAQSVTLDHLTALANARLAQLCDRYRLLRSGAAADLQLQICDAWQGDSLRPMESLSGGESFLVSLALALGLSELAGRRTRIGTLFIDEGFGTLDSTALDIALSALETLRTGHSTIAVISHVEALKTRLTTQVEVVRGAGGWSTLHVRT
jgi:exonuclease SbcC